ncbi:MAG: matrixin family metalloprotease [Acidimicrobiales bacterium]
MTVTTATPRDASAAVTTTAFDAVGPIRLVDTRDGGAAAPGAGATVVVPVRSRAGVPGDAVAASVTIVATDSSGPGFVTVWGDGDRPTTSVLNLDRAGQTRANFAITPIGADGSIRVYTQAGTHLVVDLTGVFRPAATATAGRLVPLGPTRLVDTRESSNPLAPSEVRTIDATSVGVPASADAVAISFTGIGLPGWFAAWPSGTPWPGTSVVNTELPGAPATASAIVPLANGRFDISSMLGGDVVIDVNGYFTGANATSSTEGLFVPVTPYRVADTRGDGSNMPPIGPAATLKTSAFPFSVTTAGSVALNITTVEPVANGFLTAYPSGTSRPNAAVSNALSHQVLAAGTITPASALGVNIYTQARTHLVIDTTGWFVTAERPVPATTDTTPVVSTSYKISVVNPDGTYPRWNPCQDIQVLVNFAGAQPRARASFDNAIQQARAATGFDLPVIETNATTAANGQLIVRWGTSADNSSLTGSVLGIGGFSYSTSQIVRGTVLLRSDLTYASSGPADLLTGTLAHEIGHALGLAHVNDSTQLMYPYANGLDHYQAGDLTGLSLLGHNQPCLVYPITRLNGLNGPTSLPDPIGSVEIVDVAGDHHD